MTLALAAIGFVIGVTAMFASLIMVGTQRGLWEIWREVIITGLCTVACVTLLLIWAVKDRAENQPHPITTSEAP